MNKIKFTPWFSTSKALPVRKGYYLFKHKGDPLHEARFNFFDPATPDLIWFRHGESHLPPDYNCYASRGAWNNLQWCGILK